MLDSEYDFFKIEDNIKNFEMTSSIPVFLAQQPSDPKFSISIPTYKRIKTLKDTIESALSQKGSHDYEIVVVDNNPERNDETEKFMRQYANNGIISYYKNSENLGMGGNWNRCVTLSRGEWVVLVHDDDMLSDKYLNEIEPCLRDGMDGIFPILKLFDDGKPLPALNIPVKTELLKITLKYQYLFPWLGASGNLLRKSSVIKWGGFWGTRENVTHTPDAFFCKMAYYGNVYRINKEIVYYRKGINESTKLTAMEALCFINHNLRIQVFEKLHIPSFLAKRAILFSDILFERAFQRAWNANFKYGKMPVYSRKDYLVSKLSYRIIDVYLRITRRLERELIKI